jgi:hypothetical protein
MCSRRLLGLRLWAARERLSGAIVFILTRVINDGSTAGSRIMSKLRNVMLAIAALTAAGVASSAQSNPAFAYDFPYCAQGRDVGYPGDCMYQNREQCLLSASGRGLDCNINPRAALNAQRPSRPRRHADRYDDRY